MTSGDELLKLIYLARHVQWQYKLENYTVESLKFITKALENSRNELFNEITMRDVRLPKGREGKVLKELNDLTFGIQAQLTGNIADAAQIAGKTSFQEYGQIMSLDGRLADTVGFNFVSLSPDQLQAMVVDTPVGGKLLKNWVSDNFKHQMIDEIKTDIATGMFKGDSTRKLVDRLTDSFNMLHHEAITLTRTYVASINNRAAEQVYKANSDIIKKEEWNATLEVSSKSGRGTCFQCASLDGRQWPLDSDHPRPLAHPRCRCFLLPVTVSYKELGLNIPELERVARPYTRVNGIPIDEGGKRKILKAGQFQGSAQQFIQKQGPLYLKNTVGPRRKELLDAGKITFNDLVDEKGRVVLLKDLPKLDRPIKHVKVKNLVKAKTLQDVLTDLPNTRTPSGIYFKGITKKQESSILAGLNDSVVKYQGKLNSVGWQVRRRRSLGVAAQSGDYIQFQKTATRKIHKDADRQREAFNKRRLEKIEETKKNIADPKRKNIVDYNKKRLERLEKTKRWAIYTDAKDPLRAISSHEGFHNVYFTHDLQYKFMKSLEKNGIMNKESWYAVSEYGASSVVELFPEIGCAIASKVDIPKPFTAFNEVVKDFEKK